MKKNIFVFGLGTIGSALISRLSELYNIYVFDKKIRVHVNNITYVCCDFTDMSQVDIQVRRFMKKDNFELTGVIFAYGSMLSGTILEISEKEIREDFELNVFSKILITKMILSLLHNKREECKFIFISSIFSEVIAPSLVAYNTSHATIKTYVKSLSVDFAKEAIQFYTISLGMVKSDFIKKNTDARLCNSMWKEKFSFYYEYRINMQSVIDVVKFLLVTGSSMNGLDIKIDNGVCLLR